MNPLKLSRVHVVFATILVGINITPTLLHATKPTPPDNSSKCVAGITGDTSEVLLDLTENLEVLEELKRTNRALESESNNLSFDEFIERGLLVPGEPPEGKFKTFLTPKTHTGFYIPKMDFDPTIHKGLLFMIPGIGTTYSTAASLLKNAKNLHDGKHHPELGDIQLDDSGNKFSIGFRVYPVVIDMPLNGLGSEAPGSLATATGTLEIVRHIQLMINKIIPDQAHFVYGRSQGGLIAMAYAHKYKVNGAIAINPSPNEPNTLKGSVEIYEGDFDRITGPGVQLVPVPWEAYKIVTPSYDLSSPNLAPVLITYSSLDHSYPHPQYENDFINAYVAGDTKNRIANDYIPDLSRTSMTLAEWQGRYGHDLIRKPDYREKDRYPNDLRKPVFRDMIEFMESTLGRK